LHKVRRLFLAVEERRGSLPIRELLQLRAAGVPIEDAQTALIALSGRVRLDALRPAWFLLGEAFSQGFWVRGIKRLADVVASLGILVAGAPLLALLAVAVKIDSPGPVLYRQRRVGRRGKCFELLKFRTMQTDAEASSGPRWAERDDPRATRLGRHLRRFRLDELPQLLNILRGEMSLVGPRPERPEFVTELRRVIPFYEQRHAVRPGLTGWAQVCYSYGASVEDARRKLEYDLFYLRKAGFLLDCEILLRTVRIVTSGRGAR
jgi:exopolysaccharide biosynthesis polyprenyl glycosylphosphotransferase